MAVEEGATCRESYENFVPNYVVPGGTYGGRREVTRFGYTHACPANESTLLVTMVPMHSHIKSVT